MALFGRKRSSIGLDIGSGFVKVDAVLNLVDFAFIWVEFK